jgi:exonuclease III
MKVISWNCRGLGSKMKEEAMKALIKTENPDIMLVQETKLGGKPLPPKQQKILEKRRDKCYLSQRSLGRSWHSLE